MDTSSNQYDITKMKDIIEETIIKQKERLNEQLQSLYTIANKYHALTGINPISGQKSISFKDIANNEIHFVTTAVRNPQIYPLVSFEQALIECLDTKKGIVNTIEGAKRFMTLMKETKSIGDRYLLIETVKHIHSQEIIDYCFSEGLLNILIRYLKQNCDIVTNYDYIVMLLSLLSTIMKPSHTYSFESDILNAFFHCGDPDIEDLAVLVENHWK